MQEQDCLQYRFQVIIKNTQAQAGKGDNRPEEDIHRVTAKDLDAVKTSRSSRLSYCANSIQNSDILACTKTSCSYWPMYLE